MFLEFTFSVKTLCTQIRYLEAASKEKFGIFIIKMFCYSCT